jgi:hypothetical protein
MRPRVESLMPTPVVEVVQEEGFSDAGHAARTWPAAPGSGMRHRVVVVVEEDAKSSPAHNIVHESNERAVHRRSSCRRSRRCAVHLSLSLSGVLSEGGGGGSKGS